jgi:plastocyanin
MFKRSFVASQLVLLGVVAACSGSDKAPSQASPNNTTPTSAAASSANPTGKVIVVELYTDEKGNYFKPSKIEAHRGDLIRFTLKAGVHNVHFLPDSNPGAQGLPPASDFLQIPEQTWDYVVNLAPGHYYFQCDPHALLGMQGHLEVEDEK